MFLRMRAGEGGQELRPPGLIEKAARPDLDVYRSWLAPLYPQLAPLGRRESAPSATETCKAALRGYGTSGRDRQRNRVFFSGMLRGVSNPREGSKILSFLFRSRQVCISYISETRGSTEPGMMASHE